MTGFTTDPEEVDSPEWAAAYEPGDELRVQSDNMDTATTVTIIGWSTIGRNRGLPVTRPESVRPGYDGITVETVAIEKEDVVTGDTDE